MDVSEDRLMHWVLELEKVAGQLEWLAVRRSQLSEAQFNVVRQANQLLQGEFAWTLGAFDEAVLRSGLNAADPAVRRVWELSGRVRSLVHAFDGEV